MINISIKNEKQDFAIIPFASKSRRRENPERIDGRAKVYGEFDSLRRAVVVVVSGRENAAVSKRNDGLTLERE